MLLLSTSLYANFNPRFTAISIRYWRSSHWCCFRS